jgi:predicted nucleic acid-binding protein
VKHLLDISALLAAVWQTHSAHAKVDAWLKGKALVVCPFSELGFLRISSHPKGPFKASMADARKLLADFLEMEQCSFLAADLPGLKSHAKESDMVTDCYLAELAAMHGMKLATLDARIQHKTAQLIE